MGSTKSVLANIGESLGLRPSQFSVLNAPLIEAPNSTIFTLQGGARKLPDPSKTLRPAMGVEPILIRTLRYIKNEKSTSSTYVWGTQDNDERVRLVGSWTTDFSGLGQHVISSVVNDYAEVTFYGTGLNLILFQDATARDLRVSIDGGGEGANIYTNISNNTLSSRNLPLNHRVIAASGLALGTHTVRIRQNTGSTNFRLYGFEVVTDATSIQIPQGELFVGGRKYTNSALQTTPYNSGFDGSPVLNGRGGHVVEYITSEGRIGKVIQQTNSAMTTLAAADHTNEEPIHITNWKDFYANRADDIASGTGNKAFTLEDNVTSMVFQGLALGSNPNTVGTNASGDFMNIVFVGTGIDLVQNELPATFSGTHEMVIDNTVIFSGNLGTIVNRGVWKVVAGLPFGTHVLRFRKTSAGSGIAISDMIVYGPKKPAIPSNAVELQDYFLMANYDGSTITGTNVDANIQMPSGVISKSMTREVQLTGANWSISAVSPTTYPNFGFNVTTLTNNSQPYVFRFFGTGFVIHHNTHSGLTYDFSVTVDGALNATGVARSNASNLGAGSYRAASGATGNEPVRIEFTGLPLGMHTVSVQRTAGSGNFSVPAFHIITPVYSPGIKRPLRSLGKGQSLLSNASDNDLDLSKAKAWCVFGGGATPVVYDSYNIAAVLRSNTGDYRLFFEKPFRNETYVSVGGAEHTGGGGSSNIVAFTSHYPGSIGVTTMRADAGGLADTNSLVTVAFFGIQEDEEA